MTEKTLYNKKLLLKPVENGCKEPIRIIFDTLFLQKRCKQVDLAKAVAVDRAYICRVVNGSYVPDLPMKLKIANFFGVDSRVIWKEVDRNEA